MYGGNGGSDDGDAVAVGEKVNVGGNDPFTNRSTKEGNAEIVGFGLDVGPRDGEKVFVGPGDKEGF